MGRRFENYLPLRDGKSVGYSLTQRDGFYGIRFVGPDGKRVERMTGCRKKDENLTIAAARIIAKTYAPAYPDPKSVGWDAALNEVEKTSPDLRPATMTAYRKSVRVLTATLDGTTGPAGITPELAGRFARLFLSGTFKRGKASDAKEYKRKPTTLAFHIRQLSALWELFRELAYVRDNPWKSVRKPQTDKVRKPVPTEDDVEAFFRWVHDRYPTWERLHAMLNLKALSGCRTADLCNLRSDQLRGGRVVWTADQTKQREGRAVLVPADLFRTLKRLAGPTYLWEGWLDDLKEFRPSRNRPPEVFDPQTVYWVVGNIFREYADAHPDRPRLSPHALRRRAITMTAAATQSVDATAQAIGLNPATARGYYLDAQRAFDTDETFRRMAGSLIPKVPDKVS